MNIAPRWPWRWCCWLFHSCSWRSSTCSNAGRATIKIDVPDFAQGTTRKTSQRGSEETPVIRWLLIFLALAFVAAFLVLPLLNLFGQAFAHGLALYRDTLI